MKRRKVKKWNAAYRKRVRIQLRQRRGHHVLGAFYRGVIETSLFGDTLYVRRNVTITMPPKSIIIRCEVVA